MKLKKRFILKSVVGGKYYTYYSTNGGYWSDNRNDARLMRKDELRTCREHHCDMDVEVIQVWTGNQV